MITILTNQNYMDLAVQHMGDASAAFWLAFQNGESLTQALQAGDEINIPAYEEKYRDVVNYFKATQAAPATAYPFPEITKQEGIGYWYINVDFIVTENE